MKRSITIITLIVIAILFGGSLYYLYQKNAQNPIVYQTEIASTKTIVKKTVATGSIVPKEEVLIKPNISGIIDEIFVEAGDIIKSGDLIAKVKVVPNISSLKIGRAHV